MNYKKYELIDGAQEDKSVKRLADRYGTRLPDYWFDVSWLRLVDRFVCKWCLYFRLFISVIAPTCYLCSESIGFKRNLMLIFKSWLIYTISDYLSLVKFHLLYFSLLILVLRFEVWKCWSLWQAVGCFYGKSGLCA